MEIMKAIYEKLKMVKYSLAPVLKDATNKQYSYSYAKLPEIFRACNDALIEQNLIIDVEDVLPDIEMTKAIGKPWYVWRVAVVDTESGNKLTKTFTFPSDDPTGGRMKMVQATGSMMTYAQKYIYGAILSIQFEDDPDAMSTPIPKTVWLTEAQLLATSKGTPAQIKKVLEVYNGQTGKNMSKEYREKLQSLLK